MSLAKLFLLSVWVTLVIWAVVEYNTIEHVTAPTVVVTPSGE